MLNSKPEEAALSIESIESVTPGVSATADDVAVCVVRCVEGTARLGMVFQHRGSAVGAATPRFRLTAIEWYGKQVEQLDTVHSGKVTFKGAGAETLATREVLNSTSQH
ncbi:hypothetical protein ACFWGI_18500 [Streptomyces niveus]|uniref:hypothetical protein n=1 Tax=Streptomyces niveus TaxID=193462 RepID=UPI0036472F3A